MRTQHFAPLITAVLTATACASDDGKPTASASHAGGAGAPGAGGAPFGGHAGDGGALSGGAGAGGSDRGGALSAAGHDAGATAGMSGAESGTRGGGAGQVDVNGGMVGLAGRIESTDGGAAGLGLGIGGNGGSLAGRGGRSAGGTGNAGGTSGANGMSGAGGMAGGSTTLGATPPMGWNSWNTFQCNMDEQLIEQMADVFVSSGMQAVGYEYVNLDDCWMDGRDSSGKLRWNTSKFPSGIPALAAYVHGKGLKLGIYETPNTSTCVGLYGGISTSVAVGSLGHETTDAQTFAAWGVDYLKYDKCQGSLSGFAVMRDALRASGRPIFYSINPGDGSGCPPNSCSLNLPTTANMWRIGFDINASWSSVTGLIDQNANLSSYAGPGHWNDPDMLEVGNGLSDTEGRAHFSLWAIMAAPLIAGNDLRSMSTATRETLTNAEVIAVNQDPLGTQGRLVASPGTNLQVWSKVLTGSDTRAVALLNRGTSSAAIKVSWSDLGLPAGAASVRELWSHTDLGAFTDAYTASSVPAHGVVMLKVTTSP